ncbi:hypothetical protein [Agromyces sp. SYSU T00194]|uniref:hypothetical protein n=1 Tax=Agromyces chitinivorans TaxID=3158560 RepID=UPI0033990560
MTGDGPGAWEQVVANEIGVGAPVEVTATSGRTTPIRGTVDAIWTRSADKERIARVRLASGSTVTEPVAGLRRI